MFVEPTRIRITNRKKKTKAKRIGIRITHQRFNQQVRSELLEERHNQVREYSPWP